MSIKRAFSLAETLMVMAVIGVVAAITVPSLSNNAGDQETVTKVKKIYSELDDAYTRAVANYGPFGTWFNSASNDKMRSQIFAQRFIQSMKVRKDCGSDTTKQCVPSTNANSYKVILQDGSGLEFNYSDEYITVYLDGPASKNQIGRDFFYFMVGTLSDGKRAVLPRGWDTDMSYLKSDPLNLAATWIIRYDNMDYLKLTGGKCPDQSVPTEDNPYCN